MLNTNHSTTNSSNLTTFQLNVNNKLVNDDVDCVCSLELAQTQTQFLKISLRLFMNRLTLDIRKFKRSMYGDTNVFYPSDKGIMIDSQHIDDIVNALQYIKHNHLVDKS